MSYENLLTKTENGIHTIMVNRPDKLNALNKNTVQEIGRAFDQAIHDVQVKGIILTGSGNKSFVAGADISEFLGLSEAQAQALAEDGQQVFQRIEDSPKPVIAAVNGFALGGGCELAMACHIRIASDNAKFGQPEVKLGIIPGYGATQRLTRYVGKGKALELMMTADIIDAHEALRLGLVNYVMPADQLLAKAVEILEKIKAQAPMAIQKVIACTNNYFNKQVDGFAYEAKAFGKCFLTEDYKEGTFAFLEKRKPNFKGR